MRNSRRVQLACVSAAALLVGLGAAGQANAGSFGIREQSTYFQGSAYAGSAAGGEISSMFWNSAAVTSLPGFNAEASSSIIFVTADQTATNGVLLTGVVPPGIAVAPPAPPSANFDNQAWVPAIYGTYQVSDRLFAGIAVNSPFGLTSKPENSWAGTPLATTSRIRSFDFNPTIGYKITPELSIGVGAQAEYFQIRLKRGGFDGLIGARDFEASDWAAGATAGILWQPTPFTSLGLGYRSAVSHDVRGVYQRNPARLAGDPGAIADSTASVTLPDELTLSGRQALTDRLTLLGTVEWQNWSRIGNVSAVGSGCISAVPGICETLNLNYRDGWYFAGGAEYAWSPSLVLRTGVSYEISPIQDSTRNILIPDSNRIGVSVGGSYRYSDRITFDVAYTHLFFENAPWCTAAPSASSPTTHCVSAAQIQNPLLQGSADISADILSVGAKYTTGAPVAALEPYKK